MYFGGSHMYSGFFRVLLCDFLFFFYLFLFLFFFLGKKWIYSDTERGTLHRQLGPLQRASVACFVIFLINLF